MRVSDIIAYIGRDIEDAIRLGIIEVDSIPKDITDVLGITNAQIIDTIINDILAHSLNKNYLAMSDEVFEAIKKLKKFNYEHIYARANTEEMLEFYKTVFNTVFDKCLKALKSNDTTKNIFTVFLNDMSAQYLEETSMERKVIDYIAGMTDDYILKEYENLV